MGGCSAATRIGATTTTVATNFIVIMILLLGLASCCSSTNGPYLACTSSSGVHSCRAMSEAAVYNSSTALLAMNNESGILSIPSEVVVPAGNTIVAAFRAVGHQHYTFNGTAWLLSNATAFLYDSTANSTEAVSIVRGKHFFLAEADASGGQPSWQLVSEAGFSQVTAKGMASTTVDADSITWNLLEATSYVQIASDGTSSSESSDVAWVGDVSFVQRLDTQNGLPPSSTSAATASAALGSSYASVYSALYAFYIPVTGV